MPEAKSYAQTTLPHRIGPAMEETFPRATVCKRELLDDFDQRMSELQTEGQRLGQIRLPPTTFPGEALCEESIMAGKWRCNKILKRVATVGIPHCHDSRGCAHSRLDAVASAVNAAGQTSRTSNAATVTWVKAVKIIRGAPTNSRRLGQVRR